MNITITVCQGEWEGRWFQKHALSWEQFFFFFFGRRKKYNFNICKNSDTCMYLRNEINFRLVKLFGVLTVLLCCCLVAKWCLTLCDLMAPVSMEFPRQEYWSGLPVPSPGDFPDPGTEPASPELQVDSLLLRHQKNPRVIYREIQKRQADQLLGISCPPAPHSRGFYSINQRLL